MAAAAGMLAWIGASGQAMAAGKLELVRLDEPAPAAGTRVVARIGCAGAEQPGLGNCVGIRDGNAHDEWPALRSGRPRRTGRIEIVGGHRHVGHGPALADRFPQQRMASAVAQTTFAITEPRDRVPTR